MNKDNECEEIGGCSVRLRNRFNVNRCIIDKVFEKHPLANRSPQLLLVIDDEDDPSCKCNCKLLKRALTVPGVVLDQKRPNLNGHEGVETKIEVGIPRRRIFLERKDSKAFSKKIWDAAVYIPKSTAEKANNYPAYFAFVLAHELEHVRIYRSDIVLSLCLAWLYDHGDKLFLTSNGGCLFKTWDLPHELQSHKMGKKVAVEIYGEDKFNACLEGLKKVETCEHSKMLEFIKWLKMDPYGSNLVGRLSKDLMNFLKTYACKLGN